MRATSPVALPISRRAAVGRRGLASVLRVLCAVLVTTPAFAAPALDGRTDLKLSPAERSEFLAEMRTMLGSVQGIVQGLATSDRQAIAAFARQSGNRMSRATPAAVRARLPRAFEALGGPTHLMFEELAIRAETDDMDQIARQLATTMQQCMACHAQFKVR